MGDFGDSVSNTEGLNTYKPSLSGLGESIISSLSVGVVAFDRKLKVIQANKKASKLIEINDYVDRSLASGTDSNIWNDWSAILKSTIESGQEGDFEAVKYRLEGVEKLLDLICTPLKDPETGKVIGGTIVIRDVTDKSNTEYQLSQSERLAAIGKVTGKVAHELNNPMDGILRYINLASRIIDKGDYEKASEYLDQGRAGLMRMVQIIAELLEFSRSTHYALEYATVDKIAAEAIKAMESSRGQVDISVIHDCKHTIGPVRMMSLFQIFCNLIKNALDAMGGKGKLVISIRCPEETVSIEFRDTGPGLSAGQEDRIFDPFFTTKSHGKGTGLGLSICKDIIEKYSGTITACNAERGGAVFTVQLPLTDQVVLRGE